MNLEAGLDTVLYNEPIRVARVVRLAILNRKCVILHNLSGIIDHLRLRIINECVGSFAADSSSSTEPPFDVKEIKTEPFDAENNEDVGEPCIKKYKSSSSHLEILEHVNVENVPNNLVVSDGTKDIDIELTLESDAQTCVSMVVKYLSKPIYMKHYNVEYAFVRSSYENKQVFYIDYTQNGDSESLDEVHFQNMVNLGCDCKDNRLQTIKQLKTSMNNIAKEDYIVILTRATGDSDHKDVLSAYIVDVVSVNKNYYFIYIKSFVHQLKNQQLDPALSDWRFTFQLKLDGYDRITQNGSVLHLELMCQYIGVNQLF
ncbi:hypothetical protein BgiBS90_028895 [Biomphalaria glabrata]|nr:hypothetical protein BgiBS90_028895 [Biomphalaria glabrata]